jgi:cell volume regulation protein A
VLRRVPIPRRVAGALEAESGLNDAPTVLLVTLASSGGLLHHGGVGGLVGLVALELAGGALIGIAVGQGGVWVMRRAALPSSGLYPIMALALCFGAYAVGAAVHASGFAAVYAAALVLGNGELPHRVATRSFVEAFGWLAQIGLFVMLGMLVPLPQITWSILGQAVVAGAVLTLVARPLSVFGTALAERLPLPRRRREREAFMGVPELTFVSWAALRGAVPIVLATIPSAEKVPGADRLFVIVFVLVIIDTLITAPTLPWAARRLGLTPATPVRDLDVEAAPLDRIAADLLQVRVTDRSRIHGVEINELRLPRGASVALVVRDGKVTVPEPRTVLRRGDDLLVVTPRLLRDPTEKRLRAVSESGRLAGWLD